MSRAERSGSGTNVAAWGWFLAILALTILLRWWNLGGWDMWTDEVQTLWVSQSGEFKEGPMYRTAPLNFLLTGWAMELFGADALGARLVPFAAGTLTVGLFFPLMKRWIGDRAALFGMLVLALSFWHVFWSQVARHFALETLLLLGALHLFLKFWNGDGRWSLAGACLLLLLAQFTHTSSAFFLAGLGIFVLLDWALVPRGEGTSRADESRSKRHLWALGGLALVGAVYVPVYVSVGAYLLENKRAWNPPYNLAGSLAFYVSPLMAMFGLAGAGFLRDEGSDQWLLFLCLAVAPPLLAIAASAFTIASMAYGLPALVAIAALCGVAADRLLSLGTNRGLRIVGGALVASLFLSQAYSLSHYYLVWNGLKPRWGDAVTFVAQHRSEGERLWASEGDVARYYAGGDWADWLGRYESSGGVSRTAGTDAGTWFAVYLDSDQMQMPGEMAPPALRSRVAERARVEAVFPLHYGAKNRTIVVYHLSE